MVMHIHKLYLYDRNPTKTIYIAVVCMCVFIYSRLVLRVCIARMLQIHNTMCTCSLCMVSLRFGALQQ